MDCANTSALNKMLAEQEAEEIKQEEYRLSIEDDLKAIQELLGVLNDNAKGLGMKEVLNEELEAIGIN